MRRWAAIFSLVVGLSMLGMWLFFYGAGAIPELETEAARIMMHLAAEFLTAMALLAGGWGLIRNARWALPVYYLASGALIYTLIQSPGYFLHTGEYSMVGLFGLLLVGAVTFLVLVLRETSGQQSPLVGGASRAYNGDERKGEGRQ